jgi:glycosyltransferase involved in cell wall biosynthesis
VLAVRHPGRPAVYGEGTRKRALPGLRWEAVGHRTGKEVPGLMECLTDARLLKVAVIGTYPPRQCGIATFTSDLCDALAAGHPEVACVVLPVNDTPTGYAYSPRVRFEIEKGDIASYRRAADFLNINKVDVVCVQHEYGIYGGPAGSYIVALLRALRMPVVTTLHTILRDPDPLQRSVLEELIQRSDRLVIMTERSKTFLEELYGAPAAKIDIISHGIPDMPFVDPNFYKDQCGVEDRLVLLTFGLLSPSKGVEYVIEALPAILERHPNVVYVVSGVTHPAVKRRDGESYRLSLERLVQARGVDQHVIFYNRFVDLEALIELIGAADIYITPYLNQAQSVSGTLAYAVGAGKAVVSTPYWHAEELLADGRGVLVPFRDPQAIAAQVTALLDNEAERDAMRKRAYLFGREMIWPTVARRYVESFERARQERSRRPRVTFATKTLREPPAKLPAVNLDHLRRLTDDVGVLQHAIFTVPNYTEGYTTDDNARALIAAVLLAEAGGPATDDARRLEARTRTFLWHAFNQEAGRFRNFLSFERRWNEEVGSEDSQGRALWALGTVLGRSPHEGLRGPVGRLFDAALPAVLTFTSPRAWAFGLFGIQEYLCRFSGDRAARQAREVVAERLLEAYQRYHAPDWPWFEDIVAYCNASMPHALLECGRRMARPDMVETGLAALEWLVHIQRSREGHFVPIGSNGFYRRGGERARFDQQPVEAQTMVSACLAAYTVTGEARWREEAQRAFEWFLGRNDLGLPLYDPSTGGCRDGLHPDRVNENQGAESTLAFLLALLEMLWSGHVMRALDASPPLRTPESALVGPAA